MTFNEMQARFLSILNRDDCTAANATIYLQDSMARVARTCRLPNMERAAIYSATSAMDFVVVPPDLIEVIDLYVSDMPDGSADRSLQHVSQSQLLRHPKSGRPAVFARSQAQFNLRGAVPVGATITLSYYGEFSDIPDPDQGNEITASNPDLVVYGALSFAADVFDHPSADRWEGRYQQMLQEVQGMAFDLDAKGGWSSIQPMYRED